MAMPKTSTPLDAKVPENPAFNPLSEQTLNPDAEMPPESPADTMQLLKSSPKRDPEESTEKDPSGVIRDSQFLIKFGLSQTKHQIAIHSELKTLLEHEKKILQQLVERSTKFKELKEENKKKVDDWESDHNQKMPVYSQYLTQLLDVPEGQALHQEGLPCRIQQRILYKIVGETSHVSRTAIVQLSLQNTLINDADLTLSKLKEYCNAMLKQIDGWLKSLEQQIGNQQMIQEKWDELNNVTKELKEKKEEGGGVVKGVSASDIRNMMNEVDSRLSKLEKSVKDIKHQNPHEASLPRGQRNVTAGFSVSPSPLIEEGYFDKPTSPTSKRTPDKFPTGEDYFGIPVNSPPATAPAPAPGATFCVTPEPTYIDGRIQRTRATPGQFPVDIIDVPGMGFPIPREALERGGRRKGDPMPKTPPSPRPPNYGRFTPMGASSPVGVVRSPEETPLPTHPQMGQPLDPALLPQIQEGLQKLSKRNKHLEELVANFRKMRKLLTEEMDKAVRLNQKLQRDLYYVAQEASKK